MDNQIRKLWQAEDLEWVVEVRPFISAEAIDFEVTLTHSYYHSRRGWGETVAKALAEAMKQLESPTAIVYKHPKS